MHLDTFPLGNLFQKNILMLTDMRAGKRRHLECDGTKEGKLERNFLVLVSITSSSVLITRRLVYKRLTFPFYFPDFSPYITVNRRVLVSTIKFHGQMHSLLSMPSTITRASHTLVISWTAFVFLKVLSVHPFFFWVIRGISNMQDRWQ